MKNMIKHFQKQEIMSFKVVYILSKPCIYSHNMIKIRYQLLKIIKMDEECKKILHDKLLTLNLYNFKIC